MPWLLLAALVIPLGLDLYMPVPEDNPITAEKNELGRRLFNDRRLSRDGSIACASCHDPDRAFSDERPVAVGILGRVGRRNAPALINRGYGRAFFWDARARTLEEQVLQPIEDPNEMDFSAAEAAARVGLTTQQLSHALASYVRSILSGDSPYDRYVNGDRTALSMHQQEGLKIFRRSRTRMKWISPSMRLPGAWISMRRPSLARWRAMFAAFCPAIRRTIGSSTAIARRWQCINRKG